LSSSSRIRKFKKHPKRLFLGRFDPYDETMLPGSVVIQLASGAALYARITEKLATPPRKL